MTTHPPIGPRVGAGDTFKIAKSPKATKHLWVVLTDPDDEVQHVAMVNLTTRREHSDSTVLLYPGDHEFVEHETAVQYKDARLFSAHGLIEAVRRGAATKHATMRQDVLERLLDGVTNSPYTPAKIVTYVRNQFAF